MMSRLSFPPALILGSLLIGVLLPSSFASGGPPAPQVAFEQSIHFLAPDGGDVVVPKGAYTVTAAEAWLQLIPEGGKRQEAFLLETEVSTHDEPGDLPQAITTSGDTEDLQYVVLLLPDGRMLEALGTFSGIRPRGLNIARLSSVKRKQALQAKRAMVRKGLSNSNKNSDSNNESTYTCGKTESQYKTGKTCTCPADQHDSTWKKSFTRNSLDLPGQCKMAANGAKYFCSTKGRVVGFQYKVLEKKYQKTDKGQFEGHCKIKYQCKWQSIKHSRLIKTGEPFPRIKNGKGGGMGSVKVIRKDYETKTPNHEALLKQACENGKNKEIHRLRNEEYQKVRSFDYKMTKNDIADWDTYYWKRCYFKYTYTYWPLARKNTNIYWCDNQ
jgi:hypothetical protein